MLTLFLTIALSGIQSDTYTVIKPSYNDHGQTMIVSANKTTHEQMWFTPEQFRGKEQIEAGDKVTALTFKGLEEDQFIVIPN